MKTKRLKLEKLFTAIDSLSEKLRAYKKLQQSKHPDNHTSILKLKKDLRELAEILVDEHKAKLLEFIENLNNDETLLGNIISNALNSYIRLSENNKDIGTEMLEKIISLEEPEHSQRNLKRLYERADEIIDSFNTVPVRQKYYH